MKHGVADAHVVGGDRERVQRDVAVVVRRHADHLVADHERREALKAADELRRAAEELGDRYAQLHYFEITTSALRAIMVEKGHITEKELEAKMDEVRARFNVPDELESPIKKGKVQPT